MLHRSPAPCQRTDHGRCAHRKRPLRGPARRLHRLPYRPAGRADGRRPGAEDANGYHLLDQHHSRPGDRHRPLQLRRVRPRHAQGGDRRGSESLSGDALPVLRQDQRRRHACAVRLPDARRATRHPGEYAERDELAVQPALGPVAVELGVPRRHAVHPLQRRGPGDQPRRLPGTGARSLRRLPYSARHRLPGKSHERSRSFRAVLPRRRNRRTMASPEPAQPVDGGGHRAVAEDRAEPLCHGVRQHDRCHPPQHPALQRRRSAGHRQLPEVPAGRQGRPAHARQRTPAGSTGRPVQLAGRPRLRAVLLRLPPQGRQRRPGHVPAAGRQPHGRFGQPEHATAYHPYRLENRGDLNPLAGLHHARLRPAGGPRNLRNPQLRPQQLGQPGFVDRCRPGEETAPADRGRQRPGLDLRLSTPGGHARGAERRTGGTRHAPAPGDPRAAAGERRQPVELHQLPPERRNRSRRLALRRRLGVLPQLRAPGGQGHRPGGAHQRLLPALDER